MPPIPSRHKQSHPPSPPITPQPATPAQSGGGLGALLARAPRWERKQTQVYVIYSHRQKREVKQILALVRCGLAVHPNLDQTDGRKNHPGVFSVTHLATGDKLIDVNGEPDAMRCAEFLVRALPAAALEETDRYEAASAFPEWLKEWCRACRKARVYVDPAPYQYNSKEANRVR